MMDQEAQIFSNLLDHSIPVTGCALAIERERGVPGAVRSIQEPSPTRIVTIHHPHGLTHGPREMRNRGVDGDYDIEL
jgi:hypothetical protein